MSAKLPSFLAKSSDLPKPAPKSAIEKPREGLRPGEVKSVQGAAERIRAALASPGVKTLGSKLATAEKPRLLRRRKTPEPIVMHEPEPRFHVVPLSRIVQGGKWRTEAMRSFSAPVLIWFTRGQGRITINGVTRGFGPHNAIWLPPNTMHGFEIMGHVNGHIVHFPRGLDLPLPDQPHHLRFRDAVSQAELSHLIDNLEREIERALPISDRALEYHAGLLSVWLERQILALAEGESEIVTDAAQRLSAAYASLVERDYAKARSIADFAAELGVTPTHLTRCCHQACGRSAHDVLADRIFYEARRLLKETPLPVNRIAHHLGFTSAAYFTRAFQKVTGEKPTSFRKSR